MRRFVFVFVTVFAAVGFTTAAHAQGPTPDTVDLGALVNEQATSWGLVDDGATNAVGGFSSLGWSMAESDNKIFVGGKFLNVKNSSRTESRPYYAAFDMRTGVWDETITPDVGGPVLALENAADGGIYVGGELKTWNQNSVGGLIKTKADGATQDFSFSGRVFEGGGFVRDIELAPDGWLYVSGSFTKANDGGTPLDVNGVVRFNATTGELDRNWIPDIPGLTGGIWTVSRSHVNDNVYLGGKVNDLAINPGAIAVSANDASQITWQDFYPNREIFIGGVWGSVPHHIYHIDANEFGRVFVGGTEHGLYVYDETDMSLVINHATNCNKANDPVCARKGGDFQDVYQVGDTVFATCHCWGSHATLVGDPFEIFVVSMWIAGTYTGRVNGVVAYDAVTGERKQEFNMQASGDLGGFDVLAASDGCLWVTGGYNTVGELGSHSSARDLVRWCDDDGGGVELPVPTQCVATVSQESVAVNWVGDDSADRYVIHRTVDGQTQNWRGSVTQTSFTDTSLQGDLEYFVTLVDNNDKSDAVSCQTETALVADSSGPATCSAVVDGGNVNVTWPAVTGAAKYVVYRSVNGSQQYWRGAVEGARTFTDSNRAGSLEYFVLSVAADGSRSDRTSCANGPDIPPPTINDVASCTVAESANGLEVTWTPVADNSAEYIISRSVDGGKLWWRGKVASDTSFDDTTRSGAIAYNVATKIGTSRSDGVTCKPIING